MSHLEDVVCTLEALVSELRGIKSAATSLDNIQAELADLNQHVGKIAASLERLANSVEQEQRPTAGAINATAKPTKK